MFARKAFVAASLGIVATVGWTIQGLGTAFYFRQACHFSTPSSSSGLDHKTDLGAPQCCRSLGRKGPFQAKLCDPVLTLSCQQAKSELATHGAKAYFTRG